MKKAVLIVSALMLVVSGVAAVSAYEAHVVNIKAHVENALIVSRDQDVDFGIVFPQEFLERELYIGLSNSFMSVNNTRVSDLVYALLWCPKLISEHPGAIDPDCDGYFEPIYPFLTIDDDGGASDGMLPETPPTGWSTVNQSANCTKWGWGMLNKRTDPYDIWHLAFNVPVFDQWYNEHTDPLAPYPYILYYTDDDQCNDDYAIVSENFTVTFADGSTKVIEGDVPHADLGNNLKIQVYDYSYD